MGPPSERSGRDIVALKVRQWLPEWKDVKFDPTEHRAEPEHHFYMFSIPAADLRILSGIYRRTAERGAPRSSDTGIQRRHDPERSKEIHQFVHFGYPWAELPEYKRKLPEYNSLRKPGWLPTAIVVNILPKGAVRGGKSLADKDAITIEESTDTTAKLHLPLGPRWKPEGIAPVEVIDGQHRLWAFGEAPPEGHFDVPVVAFHGLDVSWQAYLFWTINIRPKRINPSLAFDLYPLLRAEDWLDRPDTLSIYREARAQELTEALWAHPKSPWRHQINMLGESGVEGVSQAAWIRSLVATFLRPRRRKSEGVGGLFASPIPPSDEVLPWSRAQQAAFLIAGWSSLQKAVLETDSPWATALRLQGAAKQKKRDSAFYGGDTFISTDQGVRGYLFLMNDLTFTNAVGLELDRWESERDAAAIDERIVTAELNELGSSAIGQWLVGIAEGACTFDWRLASAPGIQEEMRPVKLSFKGGGGYKELRKHLLDHISRNGEGEVAKRARALHRKAAQGDD